MVSEQLCGKFDPASKIGILTLAKHFADDIIGYLAPSLEEYKGCTLIDVHPGACLWSSKLHDFLKPKRHVLMEPEMRYFEAFVKPLLDQPGSTYRHTRLVGAHAREYWDSYRQLFKDPDLMDVRPGLMPDDPKIREIDTSILLTGNLWRRYPIQHKARYVDHTALLFHHMAWAALTNEIFQQSGLVRMLWWAPDSVKRQILPSNIRGKRGYDLGLHMGASFTEVAGVSCVETNKRSAKAESSRLQALDASISGRVRQRMAEKGLKLPSGREMPAPLPATKPEDDIYTQDAILNTTCTNMDELNAAIEKHDKWLQWMEVELPKVKRGTRAPGDSPKGSSMSPERIQEVLKKYVRFQQSIDGVAHRAHDASFASSVVAHVRGIVTMDVAARLVNLEAEYAAVRDTNPNAAALATAHDAILRLGKVTDELLKVHAGATKLEQCQMELDDIISVEARPELLHRDRRPYDPIQAHPHEFWPQYEVTLLDLVPNTRDLSSPPIADRLEGAKVTAELIKHIYYSPAISLKTALERLAPNAFQDLVPQVPDITDARKGGRLDATKMTPRMLTQEMMDGLVRAFLEWPFRPSSTELTLSGIGNEESEEGEEGGVEAAGEE